MADFKLDGFLRTKNNLHPLIMRTKGRLMQFEFKEQPLQIRVQVTPGGSQVERRKSPKEPWTVLSAKEKTEWILDSDIAYEDLGIDFLRWTDVRPLGTDNIKGFHTWAYEATPPGPSNYSKARYWISSRLLGVMRVDAYDKDGNVTKRVEVNGVKEVGDQYVIEEMMISHLFPDKDVSKSRTWLEIRTAEKGSGLE